MSTALNVKTLKCPFSIKGVKYLYWADLSPAFMNATLIIHMIVHYCIYVLLLHSNPL